MVKWKSMTVVQQFLRLSTEDEKERKQTKNFREKREKTAIHK